MSGGGWRRLAGATPLMLRIQSGIVSSSNIPPSSSSTMSTCHTAIQIIKTFCSVVDPHHFDADPDSTYHPDADPYCDFYLMRIRIRLFTLKWIRIRIQIVASKKGSNPRKRAQIGSYSIHFGLSVN
jgi:hypothetical protein